MDDKILNMLKQVCATDEVMQNRDINLFNEGYLDSLGIIELLVEIENEFGINLDPAEIERYEIETPNKLIQYVERQVK